jgi:hypothetical protein
MQLCVHTKLYEWICMQVNEEVLSSCALDTSQQARLTEFLVRRDERKLLHDDVVRLVRELDARDGVAQVTHLERVLWLRNKAYLCVKSPATFAMFKHPKQILQWGLCGRPMSRRLVCACTVFL